MPHQARSSANALLSFPPFPVQLHNAAFHLHRNNFRRTKFHCFLDDQFHFVTFWQTLKQYNSGREFSVCCCDFFYCGKNLPFREIRNGTMIFLFASGTDQYFFARPHAEHIFDVINVTARDVDSAVINLTFFYKKRYMNLFSFSSGVSLFLIYIGFLAVTETHSP